MNHKDDLCSDVGHKQYDFPSSGFYPPCSYCPKSMLEDFPIQLRIISSKDEFMLFFKRGSLFGNDLWGITCVVRLNAEVSLPVGAPATPTFIWRLIKFGLSWGCMGAVRCHLFSIYIFFTFPLRLKFGWRWQEIGNPFNILHAWGLLSTSKTSIDLNVQQKYWHDTQICIKAIIQLRSNNFIWKIFTFKPPVSLSNALSFGKNVGHEQG